VGCHAQQGVALGDRFVNETELAVLEVADAAVDHVRGRGRRAADEVRPLGQRDIDPLQSEIAERGEAVDAPADDQHVRVRTRRQSVEPSRRDLGHTIPRRARSHLLHPLIGRVDEPWAPAGSPFAGME
jgi:hypothetical protein